MREDILPLFVNFFTSCTPLLLKDNTIMQAHNQRKKRKKDKIKEENTRVTTMQKFLEEEIFSKLKNSKTKHYQWKSDWSLIKP